MPWRRRLFLLLYAASGAAALVYEIAWTRPSRPDRPHRGGGEHGPRRVHGRPGSDRGSAGASTPAVPRRSSSPAVIRLRAYAACEAAIGIIAIVLPAMLAAFVPLLAWAYTMG